MTKLILLDRDGVLNEVLIDPEHGTIDSPLHPSQVKVFPWVPESLLRLNQLGYRLAICTNQPSAAKGKTTLRNLKETHAAVVVQATAIGSEIMSSHICFHQAKDGCTCRKPETGLLRAAIATATMNDGTPPLETWMVGDGVTDVQAGKKLGLYTAYFGPTKCDSRKIFESLELEPDFWGDNLSEFVDFLEKRKTDQGVFYGNK